MVQDTIPSRDVKDHFLMTVMAGHPPTLGFRHPDRHPGFYASVFMGHPQRFIACGSFLSSPTNSQSPYLCSTSYLYLYPSLTNPDLSSPTCVRLSSL
ncbi:MAG: hypothetical protein JRI27_10800, partial [Deltaproteobacteria bacterium]|nr:hypothetical protein [Deltaproteobacteria bacterium]